MTDEEKKAIEKIKSFNQYNWEMNNLKGKQFAKPYFEALDTILNLIENLIFKTETQKELLKYKTDKIEKQSKEIEELKEDKYGLEEEVQMQAKNIMLCEEALCEMQDKIKAKIEELDKEEKEKLKGTKGQDRYAIKQEYMYKRSVLQSLLEKE